MEKKKPVNYTDNDNPKETNHNHFLNPKKKKKKTTKKNKKKEQKRKQRK